MRIGRLRDKIALQRKTVTGRDPMGGEITMWQIEHTVWGELEASPLRSRLTQYRLQGESVIGVRVRTPFDAEIGMRLVVNDGTAYDIIEIDVTRKNRGELMMVARAEDETP